MSASVCWGIQIILAVVLQNIGIIEGAVAINPVSHPIHITFIIIQIGIIESITSSTRNVFIQLLTIFVYSNSLFAVYSVVARRINILGHAHAGESHHRHDK